MRNHVKTKSIKIRFKRDKNGGHPQILFSRVKNYRITIGITHSNKSGKKSNYPLTINPLGGNEQSYMKKRAETTLKESFYGKKKRGLMTKHDYDIALRYAKKKLKSERKKKKADPKQIN